MSTKRKIRARWILRGLAVLVLFSCLLLAPCVVEIRNGEGYVYSAYQLRVLGSAMRMYHEHNGCLPPAVITDKAGRPLYSWRVALLPYVEADVVYREFKLDESWDSPHNAPLLAKMPRCFSVGGGGSSPPYATHYQVFVGPGTAFERGGLTWNDFPDGLANTILIVEAAEPVPWTKPADLNYQPDQPLPSLGGVHERPVKFLCYEIGRRPGFSACFADGSVRFIANPADETTMRSVITRNGGENVDLSKLK